MVGSRSPSIELDRSDFSDEELGALSRLFDALGEGLVLTDQMGIIRLANQAIVEISGYSIPELIGHAVEMLVPDEHRDAHGRDRRRFVAEGSARPMGLGLDLHLRRKDGVGVPIDVSLSGLRTVHGPWMAAVVRDVTDRRDLEMERRRAEARYRSLVEHLPAAVFVMEPVSGSFEYMSPQIGSITGYGPGAWLADPDLMSALIDPEDRERVSEARRRGPDAGGPATVEYRIRSRDGRRVWIREEVYDVAGAEGTSGPRQGILMDISAERAAQEGLISSYEALEAADRQRRELLAHIVTTREEERARIAGDIHDDVLQTVLAIGMRLGKLTTQIDEPVRREEAGALRQQVVALGSRLRTLVFDVHPPELRDGGFGPALYGFLRRMAQEADVTLDASIEVEHLAPDVAVACYRVLQEAIVNVKKHAGASRLGVSVGERAGGVLARVEDDGRGFEVDAGEDSKEARFGIASMRERVSALGGWLRIESSGGGTVLEFWIPLRTP